MTTTPTNPKVEIQIDGEWIDITADCRLESADSGGGIQIKRGRGANAPSTEPTEVELTLNNGVSKAANTLGQSGVYAQLNPLSPYYGKIGRNQPIRIGVDHRQDGFDDRGSLTDTWGRLPDWTDTEDVVHEGDRWHLNGTAWNFDVDEVYGKIQAATGFQGATFGTYGDVDITAKVRVSNRTSEFGVVLRMDGNYDETQADGSFENGVGDWAVFGGTSTIQSSSAQVRFGNFSLLMTAQGVTAGNTYIRPSTNPAEVVEGVEYKVRAFVRNSLTDDVYLAFDWFDESFGYLSSSYSGPLAVTANTWFGVEFTATAPAGAALASYGVGFDYNGVPNGTTMYVDGLEYMRNSPWSYLTAYVTPGGTDILRVGRVVPGSAVTSTSVNLGANVVADTDYWFHAQAAGKRVRVNFWADGTDEPTEWMKVYHDPNTVTRANVPLTGEVGLFANNGSAVVSWDIVYVNQWRAHAEITQMPTRHDLSRQDHWVPVQASGILRRLGQGRRALNSAVYLHLSKYKALSSGWIPLEANYSDNLASNVIAGGGPASVNLISFASPDSTGDLALPGVAQYAHLDDPTSYVTAYIQPHTLPDSRWSYLMFFRVPVNPPTTEQRLFTYTTTGTARSVFVILETSGTVRIELRSAAGALLDDSAALLWNFSGIPVGVWVACNLYLFQNGGNVTWAWNYHHPGHSASSFYTLNGSYAGTVGTCRTVRANHGTELNTMGGLSVAHMFHYAGDLPFVTYDFAEAANAYIGESTWSRFVRICKDIGVRWSGHYPTLGEALGPQLPNKALEILDECAEVEHGMLGESRDAFELEFWTRTALYNPRVVDLDIDAGHLSPPLDPLPDDQLTRNSVRVRMPGGAFAASVQTEGPLNVNAPEDDPDGVGEYPDDPELNFQDPDDLQSAANWRRSLGTLPEPRYPGLTADLTSSAYQADPALVAQLLSLDAGRAMTVANIEVSPDAMDELVYSYTETMDQYDWMLTFVALPAKVYTQIGWIGYNTRVSPAGSVTAASFISGTNTALSVERLDPAVNFLWATTADDPEVTGFDIMVSGVRLTVVSISGTADPQTITVVQAPVNGIAKTIPAGERITLAEPWRIAW